MRFLIVLLFLLKFTQVSSQKLHGTNNEAELTGLQQNQEDVAMEDRAVTYLSFNIRPGIDFSSVESIDVIGNGSAVGFRLGIETEANWAFDHNNWSLLFESAYQRSQVITSRIVGGDVGFESSVDYKSIDLSIGLRRYIVIPDIKAKLFVSALGIFAININSTYVKDQSTLELRPYNTTLGLGLGIDFNDKLSLEFRHHSTRILTDANNTPFADLNRISIIVGYNISSNN